MYNNAGFIEEISNKKWSITFETKKSRKTTCKYAFTCKSGFPEGVNSPNNFTWNMWTTNGLYVSSI